MKRITLVLLALCLSLPVFAGDVDAATFTVSGSASVTFGMDLESQATGFVNATAADFVLNFGVPTTAMKNGMDMGPIYGEIAFKDIRVELEENDLVDNNIALNYAKIMGNNWWLSVVGPDYTIDYENAMQNGIIGVAAAWDGQMDAVSNAITSTGGFEFGYTMPGILAVELSLFSMTPWTDTTDEKNAYGVKAEVSLLPVTGLTMKAAFNKGFGTVASTALNDDVGIGVYLAYALAAGDITITPDVGVDIKMVDAGANIGIGNGLRVAMPGAEVTGAEDSVVDDAGVSKAWDDGVNSGLTLGWDYYMPAVGDSTLGLQAHFGLSSVTNLMVAVGVEVDNVMVDSRDIGFAGWGKFTMGNFAPYAGIFTLLENEDNGGSDGSIIANAGLVISNIVPLTTFTLAWNSGELLADDPGDSSDLGIVKFTVKVAY